jgi:hypothetical protein
MASWIRALVAAAVAAVAAVVAVLPTSALASADSYAYETRPHVYDAPAQLSMKRAASVAARDSPTRPAVVSWGWSVAAGESVLAANTADELLPGLPASAPKPLGLGSTGRTTPGSLAEQLAMTEVRSAPGVRH